MRYIFYNYENDGYLILRYRDDNGRRYSRRYLYYTFHEAIQKFRKDFGLRHKHIKIKKY